MWSIKLLNSFYNYKITLKYFINYVYNYIFGRKTYSLLFNWLKIV